ncbi:MAG: hypothetical protein C0467_00815 [Planctomycetaceae bacterium]|nr:hypothetical protein [Planctomycetaceae bacterium]
MGTPNPEATPVRKRVRTALIVLSLVAITAALFDRLFCIKWIGNTELTVEFAITDAETGQPVVGATLDIHSETKYSRPGEEDKFQLRSDHDGVARVVIPHNTCIGDTSGLRFTDIRVVYPPQWTILRINAQGYQKSEEFCFFDPRYRQPIVRLARGKDRLVVPIMLRKSTP